MKKKLYAIYFEPEDWLAFRESRRFNPGDTARTVFPSPFPFYGAIRTMLLKKYGVKLEYHQKPNLSQELLRKIGDENQPGIIKLYGPFVYSESEGKRKHYFPAPKNVYKCENGGYKTMHLFDAKIELNCFEIGLAWIPEVEGIKEVTESYIELEELRKLQSGQSFVLCHAPNLIEEVKTGIALEESVKKTKEGMLYFLRMYRFKNGGFFMLTDSEETVNEISKIEGVFLGSKQRWCKVKIEPFEEDIFQRVESKNIAMMLLTPAIYDGGIVPKEGKFDDAIVKAIAATKKTVVSGWDYASGKPKPICHAVSPGTVYYLDKLPKDDETVLKQSYYNEFGFGRFVYIPYENLRLCEGGE